ncbi:MAG: sulfatase [bacterium]
MNEAMTKKKTFTLAFFLIAVLIVLAFAFGFLASKATNQGEESAGSDKFMPPSVDSVILISVDTLRPDFLGCYNPSRPTPAIDSLAEKGILFEDAQCHNPLTAPSHATMLTGLHTWTHALRHNRGKISSEVTLLPEILQEKGWRTGGFVSLGTVSSNFGFSRGFDKFDDSLKDKIGSYPERRCMDTVKTALEWLEKNRSGKTFLFLHLGDPHGPYKPPKEYTKDMGPVKDKPTLPLSNRNHPKDAIPRYQKIENRQEADFYIKRYMAEVKYVDDSMALFFEKLKEWELYDKSLIIFTSDHGEAMGEHRIWFQHGTSLYFSQTAVPLIFKFPECDQGKRVKGVAGIVDLMPTILDFLGISDRPNMQGQSLLKFLADPQKESSLTWYGDIKHLRVYKGEAIMMDGMKFVDMKGKKPKMFNIEKDPAETKNVINEYPDKKSKMKKKLEKFLHKISTFKQEKQNLSPKEKKKRKKSMKALGYIDD